MAWFSKKSQLETVSDNLLFEQLYRLFSNRQPLLFNNSLEQINNGYLASDTVYSVVNKVIQMGCGIKWELRKIENQQSFKALKSLSKKTENLVKYRYLFTKAYGNADDRTTKLEDLILYPNKYQSINDLYAAWEGYRLTTGNAIVYGVRANPNNPNSNLISIHVAPTQEVGILASGKPYNPVLGYTISTYNAEPIPASEIWHSKKWNPVAYNSAYNTWGLSPIGAARLLIATDVEAIKTNQSVFLNDGVKGIITGTQESQAYLKADDIEELKSKYQRIKASAVKKVAELLFYRFPLNYLQLGRSTVEMNTIAIQQDILRRICNIYSMPSQLFNDNAHATYNNAKEFNKAAIINGVLPEIEAFKEMLNQFVLKSFGESVYRNYYIDYDLIASFPELQEDLIQQTNALAAAWWITPNEKRTIMYFNELEEPAFNQPFVPMGMQPYNNDTIFDEEVIL